MRASKGAWQCQTRDGRQRTARSDQRKMGWPLPDVSWARQAAGRVPREPPPVRSRASPSEPDAAGTISTGSLTSSPVVSTAVIGFPVQSSLPGLSGRQTPPGYRTAAVTFSGSWTGISTGFTFTTGHGIMMVSTPLWNSAWALFGSAPSGRGIAR